MQFKNYIPSISFGEPNRLSVATSNPKMTQFDEDLDTVLIVIKFEVYTRHFGLAAMIMKTLEGKLHLNEMDTSPSRL